MMIYIERLALRRMSYVAAGLAVLVGSVGLAMAAPAFSIVFATLVGFSLGCLLTMALALPPLTVIPEEIPSFSAAVFTVSYTVAVCVALLIGVIETFGPSRSMSVLPLAAAALAVVLIGATVRGLVPTGAGPKSKL